MARCRAPSWLPKAGDRALSANLVAVKSRLRSVVWDVLSRSELSAAVAESTGVAPGRHGLLRWGLHADL